MKLETILNIAMAAIAVFLWYCLFWGFVDGLTK